MEIKIDSRLPKPLYQQIRENIREEIVSGNLQPGDKLPSERALAAQVGVDFKIIRLAMAGLVDEGLIYRRPQRGTIVAERDSHAVTIKTYNIGLTLSYGGSFQAEIVRGIEDVMQAHGYHIFVYGNSNSIDKEESYVDSLLEKNVDGLIIFPADQRKKNTRQYGHYHRALNSGIPIVFVDRYVPGMSVDYVVCNDYKGAYMATQHLIDLGHRSLAHITFPGIASSISERIRGFKDAARNAGLSNIFVAEIASPDDMQRAMDRMIRGSVTGFFCVNGLFATSTYSALLERGLKTPADVSIIAFSTPADVEWLPFPLSIISQPSYEIGTHAAELLVQKMLDNSECIQKVVLDPELVIRGSTAPPAGF